MRKKSQRKIKGFNDQKPPPPEPQGTQCHRCKEWGEDRRTLWHACMYAMHEYDVPFEQVRIRGHFSRAIGEENLDFLGPGHPVPIFDEIDENEDPHDHKFFTLRVCKECRASWLQAIEAWFKESIEAPKPVGSGIFIRRNGVNVEITGEEWEQIQWDLNGKDEKDDYDYHPKTYF